MSNRFQAKLGNNRSQVQISICSQSDCPSSKVISTHVAGVTFDNRQKIIAELEVGEEVRLVREPWNRFDHNAIRVQCISGEQLGYINRTLAAQLAHCMDQGHNPLLAEVNLLAGDPFRCLSLGVIISFKFPRCKG